MGLIATIHTTDIELMAELVAVARNHGPVEIRYVDGGLELHHAAGPDAVVVPLNTASAPAAPTPATRKPATKKPAGATPDPCPHCGREFRIAAGRSRHIASCSAKAAAPTPPAERLTGHDAIRARAADGI